MFSTGIMPVFNLGVVLKSMVVILYTKVNTPYSRSDLKKKLKKNLPVFRLDSTVLALFNT